MVKKAQKQDAQAAINILFMAMDEISIALTGSNDIDEIKAILSEFAATKNNRLSYENIRIYEENGIIAGAICAYKSVDAASLDEPFKKRLKSLGLADNIVLETPPTPNDIYIDTLAVATEFRGQGIAPKLLNALFDEFKGYSFSLITNCPIASKVYERAGFKTIKKAAINGYWFMRRSSAD